MDTNPQGFIKLVMQGVGVLSIRDGVIELPDEAILVVGDEGPAITVGALRLVLTCRMCYNSTNG